jgi:putative transposase
LTTAGVTPTLKNIMATNFLPERENPRLKGFDYSLPYVYFITICTFEKRNIFLNDRLNRKIINCLFRERDRLDIKLYVYCLMPDHIHLLIQPKNKGVDISKFIGLFKSKTDSICRDFGFEGKIWQSRFYDHIVRKKENLSDIMQYILNNPVRKNLAEEWDNYPYSGYVDYIE